MANSAGRLEVEVGANIQDLSNGLKNATSELNKFDGQAGKSFNGLKSGSNQAAFALTNLGRVAQDAPFGFIGIQNNINPLLESFQRLKTETGSTGAAFKSLAQGLVGGAGLGLAVSVVTSLLTVLSQKPELVDRALDALNGTTNAATDAQLKYTDAITESFGASKTQIANVQSLLSVAKDETLSYNARLEAVNKLNKDYPALNNSISVQGINSVATKTAIDNLTNSIILQAKAQAVSKLIGEEYAKQFEAQNKSITSQATTTGKVISALYTLTGNSALGAAVLVQSGAENFGKTIKETSKNISNYQTILNGLTKQQAIAGTLFTESAGKTKPFRDEVLKLKGVYSEASDSIQVSSNKINTTNLIPFAKTLQDATNSGRLFKTDFGLMLEGLNIQISNIVNGGIASALGGIAYALGEALATGSNVAKAVGQTLLNTLGGVLSQLGQLAIATGVTLLGIKKAIQSLNPFAAIAAGVALLALAGFVKGKTSSIGSQIGGGGSAPASSGSSFSPSSSGGGGSSFSGGGTVVFEISGTNLIGVLNRAGADLKRYGG